MACIRSCDLQYLSAECTADPTCACSDVPILRRIRRCVQTNCTPQDSESLFNVVSQACGAGIANAMAAPGPSRPPHPPRPPSAEPVVPSPAPVTTSEVGPAPTRITRITTTAMPQPPIAEDTSTTQAGSNIRDPPVEFTESIESEALPRAAGTTSTKAEASTAVTAVATFDALGGVIESVQSGTYTGPNPSFTQSAGSDMLQTSPFDSVASDSDSPIELASQGPHPDATSPGERPAPAVVSDVASGPQPDEKSGGESTIGGIAGGVSAGIVLVLLILLYVRHRRRNRSSSKSLAKSGVLRASHSSVDFDWAKFDSDSPVLDKPELPMVDIQKEPTIFMPDSASTLEKMALAMNIGTASDVSERSDHKLYSHYQDVMPPPSMRSKRYSKATLHTLKSEGAHSSEAGYGTLHPTDSQTELAYPLERPPSSAFSIGTALPPLVSEAPRVGSHQTASYLYNITAPAHPPPEANQGTSTSEDSHDVSLHSLVTISRSSTMTDVSLGAVGAVDGIGRAL